MSRLQGEPCVRHRKVIQALRRFALAFPETREDHPWEHSAFKVKGKTFLFIGADAEHLGLGFKLEESHARALRHPLASPTRYGLGKHGWVSFRFAPRDTVPLDLLKDLVEESYTVIAPLSILKRLEKAESKRR